MASAAPSATGSRKRKGSPERKEGVIRWDVDKDSISKEESYSPTIEVGGIMWRIVACRNSDGKYLRIFLEQEDGDYKLTSVDVESAFKIINHDNSWMTVKEKLSRTFDKDCKNRGFSNFIKWATLIDEDKGYIKDSKFTLQIDLSLTNIKGFSKPHRIDFTDPNDPRHDIALIIGEEKVYVNKQYLCIHSPVFHAMCNGEFVEKDKKEIKLEDIDYKEFIDLLHAIYPPYMKITDDNFEHLLKLSDRFGIDVVINQCEQYIMSPGRFTMADKLVYAGRFRLTQLQDRCLDQLKSIKEVTNLKKSASYKDFTDEVYLALFHKIMSFAT